MISLIATVRNENTSIIEWWQSLQAQTIQPDEWVIVDGGSTDGTWEWLQAMAKTTPTLVIKQVVGNIATGRNAAIAMAKGETIVVTDAGCRYEPTWLVEIIKPLTSGAGDWAATAFGPDLTGVTWLQTCLAALTTPTAAEFSRDWLPSSRSVAFPKALWHTISGYPTWLPFCEDVVFDRAMAKIGRLALVRQPLVFWRPRPSVWAYWRQVFNYTRSEGHAGLNLERQLVRFGVYGTLVVIVALGPVWANWLVLGFGLGYLQKYALRWFDFTKSKSRLVKVVGLLPLILLLAAGDLAKMAGWLFGKFELVTGQIRRPHV